MHQYIAVSIKSSQSDMQYLLLSLVNIHFIAHHPIQTMCPNKNHNSQLSALGITYLSILIPTLAVNSW